MSRSRKFKPQSTMLCSREFALWLLKQSRKDRLGRRKWGDLILRYCNVSYDPLIEEEMRKGNRFFYHVETDDQIFTTCPTYALVRLKAGDWADEAHMEPFRGLCDGYSVLTTAAAFPGEEQARLYEDKWGLQYLVDECIFQGQKLLAAANEEMKSSLLSLLPDRLENRNSALIADDVYSYGEFIMACSPGYIDNLAPFSFGPICPDRLLSICTYHNVLRAAALDCARICEERGFTADHPELFCVILARTVLLACCRETKDQDTSISFLVSTAREDYSALIKKMLADGEAPTEACLKIRAFLNSGVHPVMEPLTRRLDKARVDVRFEACRRKK